MTDCLKCWWGVYFPYCPCKEDEEHNIGNDQGADPSGIADLFKEA